jgi:hypothetical protein
MLVFRYNGLFAFIFVVILNVRPLLYCEVGRLELRATIVGIRGGGTVVWAEGICGVDYKAITTTFIFKQTTGDIVISLLQGFM